jgi:hypothetical protein
MANTKNAAKLNAKEEYVLSTTLHELLNQQKEFYKDLIDLQENHFKSFLQLFLDSTKIVL